MAYPHPMDAEDFLAGFADDPAMNENRIPCERCQSEGRIYRGHPNDPNPRDEGPCPVCEGTGGELVETQPVTMEDLYCDMGVGCHETGVCFAESQGQPDRCPKKLGGEHSR